jgi:hypothetical protein
LLGHGLDNLAPKVNNSPAEFIDGYISEKVILAISEIEAKFTFESVAAIKGERRPIISLWLRLFLLFRLGFRCLLSQDEP